MRSGTCCTDGCLLTAQSGAAPAAATPLHLPQLIPAMQHYLWILKMTHSGADLDTSLEMAKGALDGGLVWTLYDILQHR